jgi:apolipoprotein D and lipocalin family protein
MRYYKQLGKYIIMISLTALFGCGTSNYTPLETVDNVDVQRYLGKWYEIALLPNSFQKGCNCTTAEYSLIDSETIRVINTCNKDSVDGEPDQIKGKAFVVENSGNAKLRVQFFWPFRGDYWILELDKDNYSYAVVGAPSRKYLWILSRKPQMDEAVYNMLLEKCREKGFDITKLEKTKHKI